MYNNDTADKLTSAVFEKAKQSLINNIKKVLTPTSIKNNKQTDKNISDYNNIIKSARSNKHESVTLPLDLIINNEMFNLIKQQKLFVKSAVKFNATVTTDKPSVLSKVLFSARYIGNEFNYSFLDNHPGIINIDKLADIPIDYEGLMAVPSTILEIKNLQQFNIHRVIYNPVYMGKAIYPRIVISNKFISD